MACLKKFQIMPNVCSLVVYCLAVLRCDVASHPTDKRIYKHVHISVVFAGPIPGDFGPQYPENNPIQIKVNLALLFLLLGPFQQSSRFSEKPKCR